MIWNGRPTLCLVAGENLCYTVPKERGDLFGKPVFLSHLRSGSDPGGGAVHLPGGAQL